MTDSSVTQESAPSANESAPSANESAPSANESAPSANESVEFDTAQFGLPTSFGSTNVSNEADQRPSYGGRPSRGRGRSNGNGPYSNRSGNDHQGDGRNSKRGRFDQSQGRDGRPPIPGPGEEERYQHFFKLSMLEDPWRNLS